MIEIEKSVDDVGSISPTFYKQLFLVQNPKAQKDTNDKDNNDLTVFLRIRICIRKSCTQNIGEIDP